MEKQRSKDWFETRKGRFTASRISELLGSKGLGLTGENYAFEMACEIVYGVDEENFTSFDMQRGINLEPLAFRKFKEIKGMDFIYVKESFFFPFGDNAGASPDGLVGNDAVLEIKSPRSKKFFKLVANGFPAIDKEYYDQMQMQMLCSNSRQCHFFNYIIFKGREMWHEIIVPRDEDRIKLIVERIDEAEKIKQEYIQYLTNNQQF